MQNLAEQIDDTAPKINASFLRNSTNMSAWVLSCALIHPDGEALRDRAGVELEPVADASRLNIIISNSETFSKTVENADTSESDASTDDENSQENKAQ